MTKRDCSARERGMFDVRFHHDLRHLSLRASGALLCLASLCLVHVRSARADGEQLMPGGTAAIGRGGAIAARPTDNMTMLHNPAGLVDLAGNQVLLSLDTALDKVCVHPYGYYGWGVYLSEDRNGNTNNPDDHSSEFGDPARTYGTRHLDSVCNSSLVGPLPQLAFSFHVTPRLSLAFGFVANVGVGGAQWGGKDGTIQTDDGPRPTPTRYQLIRTEAIGLNPTASAAYKLSPWLSIGLTLQVLTGSADAYQVIALRAGTSPANDMLAKAHAVDMFMPALTFAVYAKPTRRLRVGGTFNWSDGLDGHGNMTFTTNYYHQGATGSESLPLQNDAVKLSRVRVAQPWTATLAARYVQPRDADSSSTDPMKSELWDVEVDASYVANKANAGSNRVEVANDFTLEFRRADGTPQMPLQVKQSDLEEINLERHVLDLWTVRLGGSVNLLPNRLQVSGGGFLQTRGAEPSYASIDNFAFKRLGLGLGVTVRVGKFDLMAAYSHIFQETVTVAPPPHQARSEANDAPDSGFDTRIFRDGRQTEPMPDPTAPQPGKADGVAKVTQSAVFESDDLRRRVVNAGRYTASFNVVSVGAVYHF
jgi:hypothetical protein